MYDPDKGDPVTPCMDVYKGKIQSDGSIEKLKFKFLVRGDFHNKEMIGYTWYPTASMRNIEYLLEDASNHKAIEHLLDFIG